MDCFIPENILLLAFDLWLSTAPQALAEEIAVDFPPGVYPGQTA
jgi:hypothetical protein